MVAKASRKGLAGGEAGPGRVVLMVMGRHGRALRGRHLLFQADGVSGLGDDGLAARAGSESAGGETGARRCGLVFVGLVFFMRLVVLVMGVDQVLDLVEEERHGEWLVSWSWNTLVLVSLLGQSSITGPGDGWVDVLERCFCLQVEVGVVVQGRYLYYKNEGYATCLFVLVLAPEPTLCGGGNTMTSLIFMIAFT